MTVHLPFQDILLWQKLVSGLRWENRFHLSKEVDEFVAAVLRYATKYKAEILPSHRSFYRARIHLQDQLERPFLESELGAPPRHLAGHGRLNPKGIPYLYLASDKVTAVSEVRPWTGCSLTTGRFESSRNMRVINLRVPDRRLQDNLEEELKGAETTWREFITWLFSIPFDPRDDTAYVPTQYITERIKSAGFDGIIYDSALSDTGFNVALFDVELAQCVERSVMKVTAVKVEVREENVPRADS